MAKTDEQVHQACMERFIKLANEMKEEGVANRVVSSGLMTASAVYAIYTIAGNDGLLAPGGLEKLTGAYRQQLDQVQRAKKERREKRSG